MTFVCQTCQKLWTPTHRVSCKWWPGKGTYSFSQLRWWAKVRQGLRELDA